MATVRRLVEIESCRRCVLLTSTSYRTIENTYFCPKTGETIEFPTNGFGKQCPLSVAK